jgi:tetratricopeptide (TPR) repeat protein
MVVPAVLAGAIQVPGLVSAERTRASESALARGEPQRAQDLAGQGITAENWAASPYGARALASEALGDLAEAKTDAQEAIDREPDNWRYRLLIARIEAEQGDRQASLSQLEEARRLWPRNPYLFAFSSSTQQLNSLLRSGNPASPTTRVAP